MPEGWGVSLALALAFVLVLEGLGPLLSPARWRRVFLEVLRLNDGQIRFVGLFCVASGLLLAAWLSA